MKCEKCKENEATVYLQQSINGNTRSMHLCAKCAAQLQGGGLFGEDAFSFGGFGGNLFSDLFGIAPHERVADKTCPACGASFAEIRREGKVCCPACYAAFADELEPTIRSIHGNVVHTGRAPAARRAKRNKEEKIAELKKQLTAAIDAEKYEEAAKLRDEIRKIDGKKEEK